MAVSHIYMHTYVKTSYLMKYFIDMFHILQICYYHMNIFDIYEVYHAVLLIY